MTFLPKALDMVHSRTQGIPRLITDLRPLSLAAFSSRTNRVMQRWSIRRPRASSSSRKARRHSPGFAAVRRSSSMAAGASAPLGVAVATVSHGRARALQGMLT